MTNSSIYNGQVIHKRFKPKVHSFKYNVFSLLIDLSELNTLDKKVKLVMKTNPFLISEDELTSEALRLMNDKKISCLFIEKNLKPVGIIHIHDCIKVSKD